MTAHNINTTASLNKGEDITKVVGDKIVQHGISEADNSQGGNPPTDGKKPVQVTPNAHGEGISLSGELHGEYGAPSKGEEGIGAAVEGITGHNEILSAEGLAARKSVSKKDAAAVIPERVAGKEPAKEAKAKLEKKVKGK